MHSGLVFFFFIKHIDVSTAWQKISFALHIILNLFFPSVIAELAIMCYNSSLANNSDVRISSYKGLFSHPE